MSAPHQYHSSRTGFTLVEVLIASAILAAGLLGTANMISRSTIQDSRAYYTSRASTMMEEYLENATRIQYNATAFNTFGNSTSSSTIDGITYNMQCDIIRNAPSANLNTVQTTCTISWDNKGIQSSTQYVYVFSPKY